MVLLEVAMLVGLLTTQKRVNCSNYDQNIKICTSHLYIITIKFRRGAKFVEGEMTSLLIKNGPTVTEKLNVFKNVCFVAHFKENLYIKTLVWKLKDFEIISFNLALLAPISQNGQTHSNN